MTPRSKPYVYATWLPGLLAGEKACEWSVWLRAHFTNLAQAPNNFDRTAYQQERAPILERVQADLEAQGYELHFEDDNSFKLPGKTGTTVAGKPDIIAIKGDTGIICDIRTGKPYEAHRSQLLFYMWAIPKGIRALANVKFEGRIAYKDADITIPVAGVDQVFVDKMAELVNRVTAPDPAVKVPSASECSICPVTLADCKDRIETPEDEEPATDAF